MIFGTFISSTFRFSVLALMIVETKGDFGCYDFNENVCSCLEDVCTRAGCAESGGLWTGACGTCVCTCPDTETTTFTVSVDLFAGPYGLFSFEECGDVNPSPAIQMKVNEIYTFDQSHISNYYHPMGFAYARDGALTESPELEPGQAAEASTSGCGATLTCPAPIYYKNGDQLEAYTNLDDDAIVASELFGLDAYEPEFFYPLPDWASSIYTIQLRYNDETVEQDLFYFCHIHAGMSGRIILVDSDGIQKTDDRLQARETYYYTGYSEFDEACGTSGLESFSNLPSLENDLTECPVEFVCGNGGDYGQCIDAMNCQMMVGMTSNPGGSSKGLFLIQMIPHHANAVQMSKSLLKLGGYDECDDFEEETAQCTLEGIARSIITNQNFQIQTMVTLYNDLNAETLNPVFVYDYIAEEDCEVEFNESTESSDSTDSTTDTLVAEEQPCFSALTTAFVQGKGSVTMDTLEVGDSVLTGSGEFQSVYSIDHRDFNKLTTFLQIVFGSDNNVLEVTPNHMVFKEGSKIPVASATVRVGDRVVTRNGFEKVNDITMVERKGVFNPLTTDGTIVASGMVASTFSSLISQNEYIEIAGSSIMSYQEFFTNLLKPYKFICTTLSLELCRSSSEKVMVSELASRIFFYHNGESAYQVSLLSTVAFMLSVMQKIVVPLLYVSVPYSIFKLIIAGKK